MIESKNLTKKFGNFTALENLTCTIPKGCIYGLVGSNGAGKSTFLRTISGIYQADAGTVTIGGEDVYNNPKAKEQFVFVPDDLYFLPNSNLMRMAKLYSAVYGNFSYSKFELLYTMFKLDPIANIRNFSKGMKRQSAIVLAIACQTPYIFFDETFDGLDVAVRNLVKAVLYQQVVDINATIVVSSHALRELEDTCDQLALLHKGGIIFERDIQNLKTTLFKVQVAFEKECGSEVFDGIELLNFKKNGRVMSAIIRGDRDEVTSKMQAKTPLLCEVLPLSLEEVFVFEMEALGYKYDLGEEV